MIALYSTEAHPMDDSTPEHQGLRRMGWLRAAVLGANDGIVSTACLLLGMAAATTGRDHVLLAGFASLVAGAASMAAGEYVSVSSQADSERADLAREQRRLATQPHAAHEEIARSYEERGLSKPLAQQVAAQLMAKDPQGAYAREALGISAVTEPHPFQAALASALTYSSGAALPLAVAAVVPHAALMPAVAAGSLAALAVLGALGAATGGAPVLRATVRVSFWGALAMAATAGIGALVGVAVG